jgi:hypothetical protein
MNTFDWQTFIWRMAVLYLLLGIAMQTVPQEKQASAGKMLVINAVMAIILAWRTVVKS